MRVLLLNDIDPALWAKYLPSQLTPRALQVFSRLNIQDSKDYKQIKDVILASFNLGPQTYLRTFRTMKRNGLWIDELCKSSDKHEGDVLSIC